MDKNENLDERLKSEEFKKVLEQNNKKYTNQLIEWYKNTYLCAFDDESKRKDDCLYICIQRLRVRLGFLIIKHLR